LNTLKSNTIKNQKSIFYSFSNKRLYSTKHISNLKNNQLNSYFAGLIEGDGSIYTPIKNEIKKVKTIPHIEIAFDIKDILLFEKIIDNRSIRWRFYYN